MQSTLRLTTLTPVQLERLAKRESIELIPAKMGYRIIVQEFDRSRGVFRYGYEKIDATHAPNNNKRPVL